VHFDQNLALLGQVDGDFFDSPGRAGLFNDDSAGRLGDAGSHVEGNSEVRKWELGVWKIDENCT
jgi:hypothetical protein